MEPLQDDWIEPTKALIAEVVLEFYSEVAGLPKTLPELLKHYEKSGYLRDLEDHESIYSIAKGGAFWVLRRNNQVVGCGGIGYSQVFLDTSSQCVDAIKLFKRNGFVECRPYKPSLGDVFMCRERRSKSR